jgi:hypothetical protein
MDTCPPPVDTQVTSEYQTAKRVTPFNTPRNTQNTASIPQTEQDAKLPQHQNYRARKEKIPPNNYLNVLKDLEQVITTDISTTYNKEFVSTSHQNKTTSFDSTTSNSTK